MIQATKTAEELYYLANNGYTTDWNNLSISFGGEINNPYITQNGWHLRLATISNGNTSNSVGADDVNLPDIKLYGFFLINPYVKWKGTTACYAKQTNEYANLLCKNLTSKNNPDGTSGIDDKRMNVYFMP